MPHRKRIPANEKVPFERWEMPDLTGVRKRIAQRLDELKEEEQDEAEEKAPSPPTEEEIQAIREEARSEGYAAGFAEGQAAGEAEGRALGYQEGEAQGQQAGLESGYQQGLEQAQHEIDQQLARLQSLIQQLQGPINALDQDVEAGLLSLVDLISRALLRREISIGRDFLGEVVREAVAALPPGHERLRIFINPEDLPLVEAIRHELLEDYRLVTDPKITPGGVRVETLQSLVDCTLENRYKKVIDSLLDAGYQQVDQDFSPLSREVLAEPEAAPMQEPTQPEPEPELPENEPEIEAEAPQAEEGMAGVDPEDYPHEEYKAPELAEQKPAEPVAKVSLQRNSAPRHLPPLDEASDEASAEPEQPQSEPAPAEPSQAPESDQEEAASDTPNDNPEPQQNQEPAPAPAPEEPQADESFSEHEDQPEEMTEAINQEAEPEAAPPLTDEDEDDFFEQLLGEKQETSDSAPQDSEPEPEQEKVWAPESVHEVRYLDDPDAVMESTWEKDFQEEDVSTDDQEAEADEATAGNPEEALDELLKFEEDEGNSQDASTDDDQGGKNG